MADTNPTSSRVRVWSLGYVSFMAAMGLLLFGEIYWIANMGSWPTVGTRAACDTAFDMLMRATTQIDVDRAGILFRQGDCEMWKRLNRYRPPEHS